MNVRLSKEESYKTIHLFSFRSSPSSQKRRLGDISFEKLAKSQIFAIRRFIFLTYIIYGTNEVEHL